MCYARGDRITWPTNHIEEIPMKLGLGLPHHGVEATPQKIVEFAQRAEALGFDSLWAFERLLRAVKPAEGRRTPECYATVFAPVETLTYVAAHTSTIRLGTSVLAALFHVPVMLARRLATLDHLSAGRLVVGLGQGWSADEFATANVPMRRRGSGFEEFIEALRATWGPDPVSYQGRFYRIPPSQVSPKPVQPGGPPILIAAEPGVDAAVQRAGRLGLGLNPGISDWKSFEQQLASFRAAVRAGESPGPIVVRVNNPVTANPLDEADRGPLSGSVDQIKRDLLRVAELGVDEVMWDLTQADVPYHVQLTLLDQLITARPAESVGRRREL
jgi:probable F420-dependent oxidoreductase